MKDIQWLLLYKDIVFGCGISLAVVLEKLLLSHVNIIIILLGEEKY